MTSGKLEPSAQGAPLARRVSIKRIGIALGVIFGVPAALIGAFLIFTLWASNPLSVGDDRPRTVGRTPDGSPFDLAAVVKGRPALVNLWATWCTWCLEEMPAIAAVADAHPELAVVGLVVDLDIDELKDIRAKHPMPYPVGIISEASLVRWHVLTWPTTYLIDARGEVVHTIVGAATREGFEAAIREHLR